MQSHAARLTLSVSSWILFGVAAIVVVVSETRISLDKTALHSFDAQTRQTTESLAEARVAQSAYVANGQSLAAWAPQATARLEQTAASVESLRSAAVNAEAHTALVGADSAL